MGAGSFTESLYNVVSTHPSPEELEVNVEGPFGVGVDTNHYEHIVLVAGGIGITPCHAVLRDLVQQSKANTLPSHLRRIPKWWAAARRSLEKRKRKKNTILTDPPRSGNSSNAKETTRTISQIWQLC